ncbi:Dinitrogenase iron-molybdenum cofactor biosynthesis protein [Ferriphaselus amnicola]|jgi:nitrogen fixation protein NifX|uniref:Dinitrogenase iron-molybdenum cofactor biosynthesis protein n=1 Tax=Ferriphaselus amnicola TaxID=1188319 RepID=A0A2Z6GC62_9PROT|nr:NifB/NifX family molybdenum-iron cluster-binding protein [Ferriphaselus amnicola]BBE51000.1 Dinitrogenase iron-molybdenum cofactor biosynthesis protein [Ferriphaselus amnicola]
MSVKIAFATSDRRVVNQHFGAAEAFAIYEVDECSAHLVEVAEFIETAMDGHEGKLAAKIELLLDCAAVYCNAAGASAIQQLLAKGIQPMRVDEGSAIEVLLSGLQKNLVSDTPVWLAKHLKKQSDTSRFADDEAWQE